MGNKNKEQRPRDVYKKRSLALIDKFFAVADAVMDDAVKLAQSGEDIRSNDKRPGLSTLIHAAQGSIDEITRLAPLCGLLPSEAELANRQDTIDNTIYNLPPYNDTHCNN